MLSSPARCSQIFEAKQGVEVRPIGENWSSRTQPASARDRDAIERRQRLRRRDELGSDPRRSALCRQCRSERREAADLSGMPALAATAAFVDLYTA